MDSLDLLTPQEFGEFQLGQQEDAHDFLKQILYKLHDEMYEEALEQLGKKITDPQDKAFVEYTTLIYQIFGGYFERLVLGVSFVHSFSRMKCHSCGHVTKKLEAFLDLNVDLSNSAQSVEETLENFIAIEDITYTCEKCKCDKSRKQLTINQAPNILTLQLKKFDSTGFVLFFFT